MTTTAEFTVQEGQRRGFSLAWYSALDDPPRPLDASAALRVDRAVLGRLGRDRAPTRVSGATTWSGR